MTDEILIKGILKESRDLLEFESREWAIDKAISKLLALITKARLEERKETLREIEVMGNVSDECLFVDGEDWKKCKELSQLEK
jgi:hypothetical protein